jgi:geranylgeranyl diphosphate synthase type I
LARLVISLKSPEHQHRLAGKFPASLKERKLTIYASTLDYISNQPVVKEWVEVISLVQHVASTEPRDWRLPLLAFQAVGGREDAAIPACAALACAQVAIILIDDMLDNDPRGEFHRLGAGQTANCAAALIAAASAAVLKSGAPSTSKLAALDSLTLMLAAVAFGQDLDVKNHSDEDAYWHVVQMKSGYFFRTALELGALLAGAGPDITTEVGHIGSLYGEMIQIHDDLGDCMADPPGPDWLERRSTLPMLFAETVPHPDRTRFLELRQKASNPEAVHEAQEILIRCGAVSYCVDQLMQRHKAAKAILAAVTLPQPDYINNLLESLIAPVTKLLNLAGNF